MSQARTTKKPRMCLEMQNTPDSVHILFIKKCRSQTPKLPNLQPDCKPTIIKTAWYWHTIHPHRCKEEDREPQKKARLVRSKELRKSDGDKIACTRHGPGNLDHSIPKNHTGFFLMPPTKTTAQQIDYYTVNLKSGQA